MAGRSRDATSFVKLKADNLESIGQQDQPRGVLYGV